MAHVKRPGTSSKAPSPSLYPARPGLTTQEINQDFEREESESLQCTSKDVQNDQLTVPQHHYTARVPGPVDMEDTGSEYDNVGSDVEQDYDEVLHLPREGAVDMRYYRQYCPEEPGYLKHHAVTENINENSGAARVVQDTQVCQPSQPETKPGKERLIQAGHNLQAAAAKCNIVKGQENSYFFTDGDDIEEVLVGVKFIEDLEEHEQNPSQMGEIQDEETSTAATLKHSPEQPRRPQSPQPPPPEENGSPKIIQEAPSFPCFEDVYFVLFTRVVPGPCEPEDLIDGIIFAANYLGCTQVLSDKNPTKSVRMSQAQEAVNHIKSQDEDSHMMTEVDLFISTKAVKVLNADTQETMMDSALRTISYIADIGNIVVIMARTPMSSSDELSECPVSAKEGKNQYRMICYVFESEDAQLIAQSIGQAFSVAYREFLRANGINPTDLSQKQYSDIINSQEMYHDDLVHFSNSDNCKELYIEKQKGEILGVVIVESGWGSILPTVILAGMLNSGPAARSGKLSVGDQIMSINDTSLVGLPLATCQGIIKGLKNHVKVKLSIVSCPPVTTVLIKRPDLKFQLGFSVQNGIICSLMRGGIAERGGVRVGHRIIEINGQSVVAMAHEKIVQTLSQWVRST
ncbi:amyloid-beta A4 precursor protein-binding family A member 2 isoform X3 [Boleophthalmus pectinirostris]|uniref:amyloid-beta A4 precursor protein-binding family A member 2 isoform X3 n=1 Tax=Boleophthalmus pectinirostris TaxID=150288 RepID=UPI00242DC006|nr:amyloid-beta A4 precursor protein-binding family A member 2 isoform X3 [Boleophthalmus pectinirostris]